MKTLTDFQKSFLNAIISIPSVGGAAEKNAPYGKMSKKVLDVFLSEAAKNGFKTGTVGNRAGWVEFGSGEKLLGIICHLDVVPPSAGWDEVTAFDKASILAVPPSAGWDSDPFTLTFGFDETCGEIMTARGIVDNKGPACASFFAMKELLDSGMVPEGCRVRLILGTDEERSCSCIQYYASHAEVPDFSVTPDSFFPVVYSEKGILQLKICGENKSGIEAHGGSAVNIVPSDAWCIINGKRLSASGKAAHASKPSIGINAIKLLSDSAEKEGIDLNDHPILKFIKELDKTDFTEFHDPCGGGCLTFNPGMLNADSTGCRLRIDFRVPESADKGRLISCIRSKASELDLKTEITLDLPPLSADKNSPEVTRLTSIWARHMDSFSGFREEYRKTHVQPEASGMGTYARHIPNTLAFGIQAPWQTDQCHQANEHAAVSDFLQWIEILKEFIIEFTGMNVI